MPAVRATSCSCNPSSSSPSAVLGGVVRLAAARSRSMGIRLRRVASTWRSSPLPSTLVVPFSTYREIHLRSTTAHRQLTDPTLDPESYYVSADVLGEVGISATRRVLRPLRHARRSAWCLDLFDRPRRGVGYGSRTGTPARLPALGGLPRMSPPPQLCWPSSSRWGCRPCLFIAGVAWVGGALTLLRSFAEHRWSPEGSRSAVVRYWSGDVAVVPQQQPARHPSRAPGRAVVPAYRRAPRHRRRTRRQPLAQALYARLR